MDNLVGVRVDLEALVRLSASVTNFVSHHFAPKNIRNMAIARLLHFNLLSTEFVEAYVMTDWNFKNQHYSKVIVLCC